MDYKEKLIKRIDQFTIGVVEEFKEAEVGIFEDSRFARVFKKKDYDGHIQTIRKCKKAAMDLNFNDIEVPGSDVAAKDLVRFSERAMVSFSSVCDAYIQLQLLLKGKAEGEKLGFIEYKKHYNRLNEVRSNFNNLLRELDIAYSDYTADMDLAGGDSEYMTYASIAGEQE